MSGPGDGQPPCLFAYGTLIPGCEPQAMSSVVGRMSLIGPATIQARLYDLGAYPGVVIDDSPQTVQGRLLSVPAEELWEQLDRYEVCPHPGSNGGLFRRVRTIAICQDGQSVDCWVYVYDRPVRPSQLVASGCWLTHLARIKM